MSLTCTVNGTAYSVHIDTSTNKLKETVDGRSTLVIVVQDNTGVHFQQGQPITLTDSNLGILFNGFVNDSQELNLPPSSMIQHQLTCVDGTWIPGKRYYYGQEYTNRYAGDIATDLLATVLAPEGVTAGYAGRSDTNIATLGQGTLSNVATNATDNALELAPAGSPVVIQENTASTFSTGTLNNTVVSGNALQLAPVWSIHMTGNSIQENANGNNGNYCYYQIWHGSHTVTSSDWLQFYVWIPSTSGACNGGIDVVFSDGTTLRTLAPGGTGYYDQNGLAIDPATDLSGYANDQWYQRNFYIGGVAGKTISQIQISLSGGNSGIHEVYVSNIAITQGSLYTFFNNSFNSINIQKKVSNIGYTNISIAVVEAYAGVGTRTSNGYSLSALGITNSSLATSAITLNGAALDPSSQGPNKIPYYMLQASVDGGATFQTVPNNGAVPSLLPGMYASGQAIILQETLQIAGPDPTQAPVLTNVQLTFQPSYSTTVNTLVNAYNNSNFSIAGTNSGTQTAPAGYPGVLAITGAYRSWLTNPVYNDITMYGSNPAISIGSPDSSLAMRTDPSEDFRARMDWAGQWTNFVAEVDVYLDTYNQMGICWHSTNWGNGNNTFAYAATLSPTQILFNHGTNSSSGTGASQTIIAAATVNFATGNWYRFSVVANGNNYQIYVNGVQYINTNDSTYTSGGYLALRQYNSDSAARHTCYFNNFGVQTLNQSGTWTSNSISLSSLATAGNSAIMWNAVTPSDGTLTIQSSLNGAAYQLCTNGGPIPGLTPGMSLSGATLKLQAVFTSANASDSPQLSGLSAIINSYYSASGSRIAPPFSLAPAGRIGNTLAAWNAAVPMGTSLTTSTSLDGVTYTPVVSGGMIAGIASTQTTTDFFQANSSSSYISSCRVSGAPATWTYDLANSRLNAVSTSNGGGAIYAYALFQNDDMQTTFDLDTADGAGAVLSFISGNQYYVACIYDGSASTSPNTVSIKKMNAGTYSTLATASIAFTRGVVHRFIFQSINNVLSLFMDGAQLATATDSSYGAGFAGLFVDNNTARFYSFQAIAYGPDGATLPTVYSLQQLSTIDPTQTPKIYSVSLTGRNALIQSGALLASTSYSILNGNRVTIADIFDDLVKQSSNNGLNFWWRILVNPASGVQQLVFQNEQGTLAPFVINSGVLIGTETVDNANNVYRNIEWIAGGQDTVQIQETFLGDGVTTTFSAGYKIDSINSITLDGDELSFGVKSVDTGDDWYYTPGDYPIVQDASQAVLADNQELTINYNGIVPITVKIQNDTEIANCSAIDGTTGRIELAEDGSKLANKEAMITYALGHLAQYGQKARSIQFDTVQGVQNNQTLHAGHIMSLFLPVYGFFNTQMLITEIDTTWRRIADGSAGGSIQAYQTVYATSGPVVGDWTKFINDLAN
jgi:hypothetical protein